MCVTLCFSTILSLAVCACETFAFVERRAIIATRWFTANATRRSLTQTRISLESMYIRKRVRRPKAAVPLFYNRKSVCGGGGASE